MSNARQGIRRKTSSSHLIGGLGGFSRSNGPPQTYRDPNAEAQSINSNNANVTVDSSTASIRSSVPTISRGSMAGAGVNSGGGLSIAGPETLAALVEKRTACWWYIRQAHDGNESWFHTITLTRTDIELYLESTIGITKIQQRSRNLFMLGLSVSPLFDIGNASDMLRMLVKLLDEWEVWSEGGGGKGMKNLFRGQKANRKSGLSDYTGSFQDTSETFLVVTHLPFQPDYFQTVISVCEVIRQIYVRIGTLLIPDGSKTASLQRIPSTTPTLNGNGPQTARSISMSSGTAVAWESPRTASYSTTSTASGGKEMRGTGGVSFPYAGHQSRSAAWQPGVTELIVRADGKLKKILVMLTKEMEMIARQAVGAELALLMPGVGQPNLHVERDA